MATPDPGRVRPEADDRSIGELVASIGETVSRLFRQEVALAKAETRQEVQKAGSGVAMLAVAGAFALVGLILVSWMLVDVLADYMDLRWAYLLVGVAWMVVAAVLAMSGKRQFTRIDLKPERTTETLSEIPDTMRGAR
jgi:hypothetical protein